MKIVDAPSNTSSSRAVFELLLQGCRQGMARLREPYRPERHYMRGPGPKSREPHPAGIENPPQRRAWVGQAVDRKPGRFWTRSQGNLDGTAKSFRERSMMLVASTHQVEQQP
jgi:hypothetical protein